MGSRSHVLVGKDTGIFSNSLTDIVVKETRYFMGLDLMTGIGDDECKQDLISMGFSVIKWLNI